MSSNVVLVAGGNVPAVAGLQGVGLWLVRRSARCDVKLAGGVIDVSSGDGSIAENRLLVRLAKRFYVDSHITGDRVLCRVFVRKGRDVPDVEQDLLERARLMGIDSGIVEFEPGKRFVL